MKKFQVTVVKTAIYEVEVDEKIWNAEEQKKWEEVFYELPIYDDKNPDIEAAAGFAEALARESCHQGMHSFIEGFGYCASSKELADTYNCFAKKHSKTGYTDGLYIVETSADYDCETKEIK